jgi:hypothetical protein
MMHVVTVEHRSAYWTLCYGPFDTYLEAQNFWKEHLNKDYYRISVLPVKEPREV